MQARYGTIEGCYMTEVCEPQQMAMSSAAHHLIVPFAAASSARCQARLDQLTLRHLPVLLGRLQREQDVQCDEYSYSPPHEHVLARALGWPEASRQDGCMPWAAHLARRHGLEGASSLPWGVVTLCHWQIHADHVTMAHPADLHLSAAEGDALLAAMHPWFAEEGLHLVPLPVDKTGVLQWLACGPSLEGLRTASLDRVCGRNVEGWMALAAKASTSPTAAHSAPLRRLQSEMQMLLYTHPVNDARAEQGALPVNSFWLWGAGSLPAKPPRPSTEVSAPEAGTPALLHPHVLRQLALPALHEDWDAWEKAWHWLDEAVFGPLLAQLRGGQAPRVRITLCSERGATTWHNDQRPGLLRLLGRQLRPLQMARVLESL